MRILIIGGTRFLGRHLVETALARNHEVTLFNRGKSNPDLFPQLETILGDRETDVEKLQQAGMNWDMVIDVAGYLPRVVRLSAEVLKENVGCYVYISSISVYSNFGKVGIAEADPVGRIDDEATEEIAEETYGPLKALCERAVQDIYGERVLIIRPRAGRRSARPDGSLHVLACAHGTRRRRARAAKARGTHPDYRCARLVGFRPQAD